jgi:hypothetical protein
MILRILNTECSTVRGGYDREIPFPKWSTKSIQFGHKGMEVKLFRVSGERPMIVMPSTESPDDMHLVYLHLKVKLPAGKYEGYY